jgi:signal transduction histidine kinase
MAAATLDELSRGLYPRALAETGVAAALREASVTSVVPVEVLDATTRRYPQPVEAAVYFACLEAVQNAVKHAAARSIIVQLGEDGGALEFAVHDDGRGIIDKSPSGTGLSGMRDRIDATGGTLMVSGWPDSGTTVAGRVPS